MGEPAPSETLEPTPRDDLAGLVGDVERLEALVAGWDDGQRMAMSAYRRALEALHGEALRRMIRELKREPAALSALKRAAADEVVYAVLRHLGIVKPSLAERVDAALASVRPMLASHGGDVDLVAIDAPRVTVRFTGACDGCPSSQMTFHAGVKQAIEDGCPEITEVVQAGGGRHAEPAAGAIVSPFALARGGSWRSATELEAIPERGLCAVELDGRSLILSRRGGQVSCFRNACAHLGMPLDGGAVADGVVECPYHAFRYDLATGECLTAPTVALTAVPVRVVGSAVQVKAER